MNISEEDGVVEIKIFFPWAKCECGHKYWQHKKHGTNCKVKGCDCDFFTGKQSWDRFVKETKQFKYEGELTKIQSGYRGGYVKSKKLQLYNCRRCGHDVYGQEFDLNKNEYIPKSSMVILHFCGFIPTAADYIGYINADERQDVTVCKFGRGFKEIV